MCKRNNSGLFFTCSLIEQLGRMLHARRGDVVAHLGEKGVRGIYDYADVLHCEPIAKVAEDAIAEFSLPSGDFDNVSAGRYLIPSVWTMGKVYARLIEDVSGDDNVVDTLTASIAPGSMKGSPITIPPFTISPETMWRSAIGRGWSWMIERLFAVAGL